MPNRQRKRQRNESDKKDDGERRPSPPPPAPPSLIKLLKKDKKVLEYFRALQVNLNYDVEKWKKRSYAYKEEAEDLKREQKKKEQQIEKLEQSLQKAGTNQHASNAVDPGTTKEQTEIDDSAFDLEFSSSSEEEHGGDNRDNGHLSKPMLSETSKKQANGRSYKFNVDDDDDDDDDEKGIDEPLLDKNDENFNAKKQRRNTKEWIDASDVVTSSKRSMQHSGRQIDSHRGDEMSEVDAKTRAETVEIEDLLEHKLVPKHFQIGWDYLRRAEVYLKQIGVVLATAIVIDETIDGDGDDSSHVSNDGNIQNQSTRSNGVGNDDHRNNTVAGTIYEAETKEKQSHSYTSYIRRDDSAVLGDIVQIIKEWTKLKITAAIPMNNAEDSNEKNKNDDGAPNTDIVDEGSRTFKHQYAAFATREVIPCFVPLPDHLLRCEEYQKGDSNEIDRELESPKVPQHPAVRGVEILLKAIAWIDAFGSILDEIEIDGDKYCETNDTCDNNGIGSYFTQLVRSEDANDSLSPAIMFITGMKKRHVMIQSFVKSLEGEICDAWPVQDRFSRLGNPALHDDRDQSDDSINNHSCIEPSSSIERRVVFDSKNSLRLATMVDRCIFARIVTAIYMHRSDPSSAVDFLFRYILATAPSLQQEHYPKYPPVQSLLMIETILETSFPLTIDISESTHRTLLDYLLENTLTRHLGRNNSRVDGMDDSMDDSHLLSRAFQVTLATTAAIYRWRMSHGDTRISEPGFAEEAAYQRINSHLNRSGTQVINIESPCGKIESLGSTFHILRECCKSLIQFFVRYCTRTITNVEKTYASTMLKWMLPVTIIVEGDHQKIRNVFSEKMETFLSSNLEFDIFLLEGCARAIRQIEIQSIDSYRAVSLSPTTTDAETLSQSLMTRFVDLITAETDYQKRGRNTTRMELSRLSVLIGICHELADGENALRLIQWWLKCKDIVGEKFQPEVSRFFDYWSAFPMVRVINLERRKDRLASFLSQAMHAGLWAIHGVIPPERWEAMKEQKDAIGNGERSSLTSYIGTFAIDGSRGSPAQVELKLMEWLEHGGIPSSLVKRELESLVKPQWRPNDLRAFDVHASDDAKLLVSLTPSEKACALSHIATWKGIASSSFANSFTYTGFARGEPMHNSIGNVGADPMPPCPVALVLEDDANLVDRFQDRLDQLLEELPRDFHYCALGYARPKEAPLLDIPGYKHIKLPTMTWYLTGYLLSQSGAQYLLNNLPVIGPIDAWMGRKMILTSNWENEIGHRMGVGDAPQTGSDYVRPTLSRREIRLCVKFRAYCATVPLCDQKVRTAKATGASATNHNDRPIQNWRLRDSDIVYSGSVGTKNRKWKSGRKGG